LGGGRGQEEEGHTTVRKLTERWGTLGSPKPNVVTDTTVEKKKLFRKRRTRCLETKKTPDRQQRGGQWEEGEKRVPRREGSIKRGDLILPFAFTEIY